MRLNFFLPYRRRRHRGPGRRLLAVLGPTWLATPVRRVVQLASLAVFLWLFLYVAWPYTARPARNWPGWSPIDVDAASGRVTLSIDELPEAPPVPRQTVYVSAGGADGVLGEFSVQPAGGEGLVLDPVEAPTPAQIDQLSTSFGPWTLYEADPRQWPSHYAGNLQAKERLPAESFLAIDPLVSISTALAARCWVWSLGCAAILLAACAMVPRGFCAFVCPLGTILDGFDALFGRGRSLLRPGARGWWIYSKYGLLTIVFAAAAGGVLLSGFVAAIPVVTRGLLFLLLPLQTGLERGWHQVPPVGWGHGVSLALFFAIVGLGMFRPRFWCKCVCPSGAVISLTSWLRLTQRKVRDNCIRCGKCVEICPFDAIEPNFATRTADCTFCQACGGACPVGAIQFVGRWQAVDRRHAHAAEGVGTAVTAARCAPPSRPLGRRQWLTGAAGAAAAAIGGEAASMMIGRKAQVPAAAGLVPVRPPGSVPEPQFLQLCIRCGECLQACPNAVLQPLGFQQGLDGLWTPQVVADWSGCEPSCNLCGQVCPTGAIRALPLEEKRVARMGLAVVNRQTCLPYAGREACQLCVDECTQAGYRAIEFTRVGTQVDERGQPLEDSGFVAPVVVPERCVGCGMCQTRCFAINVTDKRLLTASAVQVEAGDGTEDRLAHGSYVELRRAERKARQTPSTRGGESYLPDFLK